MPYNNQSQCRMSNRRGCSLVDNHYLAHILSHCHWIEGTILHVEEQELVCELGVLLEEASVLPWALELVQESWEEELVASRAEALVQKLVSSLEEALVALWDLE